MPSPSLEKGEVHIWRVAIDLPDRCVHALQETLALDELARACSFRFKATRDRFVAARGLLRAILTSYLDTQPARLRFGHGPYGKPALHTEFGEDVRFNLSHAGGLALYAFARDREIGIDLEQVRPHAFDERVAAQCFSSQDNAMLRALPLQQRQEAFFRCWTRKEAYAKARGGGLSEIFAEPDVSVPRLEPMALGSTETVYQRASPWFIRELNPGCGYVAALAVEGTRARLIFGEWPSPASQPPSSLLVQPSTTRRP